MPLEQARVRRVLSDSEAVSALAEMQRGGDPSRVAAAYGVGVATMYRLRSAATARARTIHEIHRLALAARHAREDEN